MKYNAQKSGMIIPIEDIHSAATLLISAIRHIRIACNLPLDKYERDNILTDADHAQRDIIEASERLGIDLGGRWGNDIDVRT